MEDSSTLDSIEQIYAQLRSVSQQKDIIHQIQTVLNSWDHKLIHSTDGFKTDIKSAVEDLITLLFEHCLDCDTLPQMIKEVVLSEIYDSLFSCIKSEHTQEDLHLYKIAKEFCKKNGTPKQLGSTFYNFIPSAAVVELSMISNKRTPMEKLKCLQAVYDYVFAEVKRALISVISKYSDKEVDIPFIENREVFPIIMAVILKSKLFYLKSEMAYVKDFGSDILILHSDLRELYKIFEKAVEQILIKNPEESRKSTEQLDSNMSVCDTINFIESLHKETTSNRSVLNEEKMRVAQLITSATTENLDNFT